MSSGFSVVPAEAALLDGTDLKVLVALASFADKERRCKPSVAKLMPRCGLGRSAVFESLNALVSAGVLRRERNRVKGRQGANSYVILFDPPGSAVADSEPEVQGPPSRTQPGSAVADGSKENKTKIFEQVPSPTETAQPLTLVAPVAPIDFVAAYVEAYRDSHRGERPTKHAVAGGWAKRTLALGKAADSLLEVMRRAGAAGKWTVPALEGVLSDLEAGGPARGRSSRLDQQLAEGYRYLEEA